MVTIQRGYTAIHVMIRLRFCLAMWWHHVHHLPTHLQPHFSTSRQHSLLLPTSEASAVFAMSVTHECWQIMQQKTSKQATRHVQSSSINEARQCVGHSSCAYKPDKQPHKIPDRYTSPCTASILEDSQPAPGQQERCASPKIHKPCCCRGSCHLAPVNEWHCVKAVQGLCRAHASTIGMSPLTTLDQCNHTKAQPTGMLLTFTPFTPVDTL
jgi:hypothetical protein